MDIPIIIPCKTKIKHGKRYRMIIELLIIQIATVLSASILVAAGAKVAYSASKKKKQLEVVELQKLR